MSKKVALPKIVNETNTLVAHFDLQWQPSDFAPLQDWIQEPATKIDDFAEATLEKLEKNLLKYIDSWFEEDLKMKFLSFIFFLSDITEDQKIDTFFEKIIKTETKNVQISVVVDCMISSVLGLAAPKKPYFFMQEFKKSKGDSQDAEGQMLAAMIAAQHLNNNEKPLYGAYVIGDRWYFSILEGKNYAKTQALSLIKPSELRQVILTLRELKRIILQDFL
jgi:hypothetical protein